MMRIEPPAWVPPQPPPGVARRLSKERRDGTENDGAPGDAPAAPGLLTLRGELLDTTAPSTSLAIEVPSAAMTIDWWQWALHMESNGGHNAFEDTTGDYAYLGAVSPNLFFVAGAMGNTYDPNTQSTVVTREVSVQAGADLLVPVFNIVESLPDYKFFYGKGSSPADVASFIETYREDWVQTVFLTVDGHKIIDIDHTKPNHHDVGDEFWVQSPCFSFGNEKGQSFQPGQLGYDQRSLMPQDAVHNHAMSGGWWAVIENLSEGDHRIEFGGTLDWTGDGKADFTLDITDRIHVVAAQDALLGA